MSQELTDFIKENEKLRMQLAACAAAAKGMPYNEIEHGSPALVSIVLLRSTYLKLLANDRETND